MGSATTGFFGREASEQVTAHRRACCALRGEPQGRGPRSRVRARHDHARGRQGREGRDHGLRLVREASSRGPLGPQPADRRAHQGQEDLGAEVHRRRRPEERRLGREEAAQITVRRCVRRPRRLRLRPRRPLLPQAAKKAAPAEEGVSGQEGRPAAKKAAPAKKASGCQEGPAKKAPAAKKAAPAPRRRPRPRRPPAKKAPGCEEGARQEGSRRPRSAGQEGLTDPLTPNGLSSSEGGPFCTFGNPGSGDVELGHARPSPALPRAHRTARGPRRRRRRGARGQRPGYGQRAAEAWALVPSRRRTLARTGRAARCRALSRAVGVDHEGRTAGDHGGERGIEVARGQCRHVGEQRGHLQARATAGAPRQRPGAARH